MEKDKKGSAFDMIMKNSVYEWIESVITTTVLTDLMSIMIVDVTIANKVICSTGRTYNLKFKSLTLTESNHLVNSTMAIVGHADIVPIDDLTGCLCT